jgi:two-component system sensor histidine kinase DegS
MNRDKITLEEKQIRQKLERINLVLRTMRSVDQLILEESNRQRLIKGVCRCLVATRGYYNAWILLLDRSGKCLMTAESGLGNAFHLLAAKIKREGLSRCGRQALAQPSPVVVRDPPSACTDCPLAGRYQGRGGITSRLYYRGTLYGLLCASVPSSLVEEKEECSLFEEIARDVAFALHKIGLEEEHARAQENLRVYARQAIMAQEEERKRIARELHDETAQALASLGMDIGSLAKSGELTSARLREKLETLRTETKDILEGVRALSRALRPPLLEEFGLLSALKELVKELKSQVPMAASFEVRETQRRLTQDTEIAMYRVAQEALSNVRKYAEAGECTLVMTYLPQKVVLEISDNGRGFTLPEPSGNLAYTGMMGLAGMQERAKLIGGKLTMKSHAGKGTVVRLEVPAKIAYAV